MFVLNHEVGHIFGLEHSDGKCMTSGKLRTIMEGSPACGETPGMKHTNYFSNPDVIHPETNTPAGDENHNSAKLIKERRFLMEAVGDESGTCPEVEPKMIKRCFKTDPKFYYNDYDQKPYHEIKRNEKVATLPFWGPTFKVKFDIIIRSFDKDTWTNVFHFTTGDNCCKVGDRIPMIKTKNTGELVIINALNNNGNHQTYIPMRINEWNTVEITQTKENDKVRN